MVVPPRHHPRRCRQSDCSRSLLRSASLQVVARASMREARANSSPMTGGIKRLQRDLRVAIVGAGMAGLAAARELRVAGAQVALFDKGRRPGGRVATRRDGAGAFDHGAQFCTVRDPVFEAQVEEWRRRGVVAPWPGPFRTLTRGEFGPDPRPGQVRWCGVPGMSALARDLAEGRMVASGVRIRSARRAADGWRLADQDGADHGPFDELLLALPPPQAAALLPEGDPLAAALAAIRLAPCLAAMVVFADLPDGLAGGSFVADPDLAWVAHDGGKPGRGGGPTFVLHGTAAFSDRWLGAAPEAVGPMLLTALARALDRRLPAVAACTVHRWRHALPVVGAPPGELRDAARGLHVAGDFARGGRVEGAFCSGVGAAGAILGRHGAGGPSASA